jgi:phosphoribosylglycinamide formyltransferase-1
MTNIAILASGSGTNAQRVSEYFAYHPSIRVKLILSNKPDLLRKNDISFIVLAGFLWLLPENLLNKYPGRIVNIHPALLPKYGGKGMYGLRVHEAVIRSCERESGISIHYVNEKYDAGDIIFRASCPVMPDDTVDTLAARIHELEYKHYPGVIEEVLKGS